MIIEIYIIVLIQVVDKQIYLETKLILKKVDWFIIDADWFIIDVDLI